MASTVDKTRDELPLLSAATGFVFAFRVSLTFLWFQDEPQSGTIVWLVLSLILLSLAALFTIGSAPNSTASYRTTPIRWAAALLGLSFASIFWSQAPLDAAAGYWLSWAADVATVWVLLRDGDPEIKAAAIMKGFVCGACIVAIVAWMIPARDDLRLGDEIFLHPNALGFLFSIATLLAVHLAHETRLWRWPALFLATTLLRTISKSAIFAFLMAFCFYLLRDSTLSRKIRIRIGIAAAAVLVSLSGLLEAYFATYAAGTDPETLTGRTIIWAMSIEYAIKKPFFGNGFYSYRFVVPPFGLFEAQQAHNELLQQFFAFGAVGALLTIALYWAFFRQVRRAPASHLKALASAILVFAFVRGLTDTQIYDLSLPLWLMTILSILLSIRTPQSQPAETALFETSTT
ncbi:O-antigen ligase family protein [Tunturiibacter gelidiferens]|uniref:O-antigen ligase family protein n=1 Tax=Tunturiibacter gelidiferens TaxID=3069689 RepID=UPI003D9B09BB